MKKIIIVLMSITPLFLGYLLNHLMMKYDIYGFKVDLFSVIFYFYWFCFGYLTGKFATSAKEGILLGNVLGIICTALIIGQMILIERFSTGYLGMLPQMYFLPSISIIVRLDILNIIHNGTNFLYAGFAFMILVFYLGFRIAREKKIAV